jgi:hypothetical protein
LEGRALSFVYPGVRRIIKERFVPVTRSALHSSGYEADDRFWDKVQKQGAFLGNNIGVMCTPDGTWLGDKDIDKALAAWAKLPADSRRPGAVQVEDRGPYDPAKASVPPPGGLIVREYYRELDKDGKGQLCVPRKRGELMAGGKRYELLEEPNRDFLWLTEAEWKALVPETAKEGDAFPLPDSVRDRILRFHLIDAAKGLNGPWSPAQVRKGDVALTVTEATADRIQLRLDGAALLADKADAILSEECLDARIGGYLEYDRKARTWTRFDIVAAGPYRGTRGDCQGAGGSGKKVNTTLGFVFELAPRESWVNGVPPRGATLETGSSKSLDEYFRGAPGTVRADTPK